MVTIGRDEDDDVRIDEPNASRHHARLHVGRGAGDRGPGQHERHAPARQPAAARAARAGAARRGDLDRVGDADDPAAPARRCACAGSRRTPTSKGRLEEECDKASSTGRVFAVLRLHVAPGTSAETVGEIVTPQVRPGDVLASYGPDEYEMILFEHDAKRVDDFGARVVGAARRPQRRRAHRRRLLPGRRALRRRPDRARLRAGAGPQRLGDAVVGRHPLRSRDAPRFTCWPSAPPSPTSTC